MRNVIVKGIILVFLFTTGFHLIKLASDLFLSGWSGSQKELLFLFLYSAVFWIPGLGLVIIGLKILFPNINISFFKPRLKKCRICTKTTQDILVVEEINIFITAGIISLMNSLKNLLLFRIKWSFSIRNRKENIAAPCILIFL